MLRHAKYYLLVYMDCLICGLFERIAKEGMIAYLIQMIQSKAEPLLFLQYELIKYIVK